MFIALYTMAEDINRYNFEKITYLVLGIYVFNVGITYCICRKILIGYKKWRHSSSELTRPKIALTMASLPIHRRLPQVIVII